MRAILTTMVIAATLLAAAPARADAKVDAKRHFDAGYSLMQSEDYAAAALEFEESYRLYKTKTAIFNLANCYKALKRFDDELAALDLLEKEFGTKLDPEMKAAVATMRKDVATTTGTVEVKVDRPGARVLVDGAEVGRSPLAAPLRLAPGVHEVRVELAGMAPYGEKVKLLSGDKKVVTVALAPAADQSAKLPDPEGKPEEPPAEPTAPATAREGQGPRRSPALLAVSVVATAATVGLGVAGGVFWKKAVDARDDYDDRSDDYAALDPGSPSYSEDEARIYGELVDSRDAMTENNNVAVGLTVGAGIAAAASAVFWVLWANSGDESAEPAAAALAPAPGGVAVAF